MAIGVERRQFAADHPHVERGGNGLGLRPRLGQHRAIGGVNRAAAGLALLAAGRIFIAG